MVGIVPESALRVTYNGRMASSFRTKRRIASSILFATGFFDALAGRFLFQPSATRRSGTTTTVGDPGWRDLSGALHVHSTYSDGASDIPTVMDAAREAGVDFVLLADHNTQRPLRDGWEEKFAEKPLLLIGTEVTVEHGAFLLALDMPPEWEPTKHQPPQVAVDEINAHGGLPLVSLPFDMKHPWLDWNVSGYRGLEVINVSTVARRHINLPSLLWLVPLFRRRGAMAVLRVLLTRPDRELALWDELTTSGRPMIGICALDAHALMKIGKKKHPIPSYADSFRTATTHFWIPPDAETAPEIRRALYESLRAGRCYMAYDCLGDPSQFTFTARGGNAKTAIPMGGCVTLEAGGVVLQASVPKSEARVLLRLLRDGKCIAASTNGLLEHRVADRPGVYRIEAFRYSGRVGPFFFGTRPWIFSNPIYITGPAMA